MSTALALAGDARRLRLDDDQTAADLSRAEGPPDGCTLTLVGQTVLVQTYPTTAQAFYGVLAMQILGNETEGGAGIVSPAGGSSSGSGSGSGSGSSSGSSSSSGTANFYALNLGSQAPPLGTVVICYYVDYRWVFRYDGTGSGSGSGSTSGSSSGS